MAYLCNEEMESEEGAEVAVPHTWDIVGNRGREIGIPRRAMAAAGLKAMLITTTLASRDTTIHGPILVLYAVPFAQ